MYPSQEKRFSTQKKKIAKTKIQKEEKQTLVRKTGKMENTHIL